MKRHLAPWLVVLLAGTVSAAELAPASPAPKAPAAKKPGQTAEEKQACVKNLKLIYSAIQAFQADHQDLPNWLSDLVPQYLEDANVLICPVCRRTGRVETSYLSDPKLPSSYLYEFSPVPLGRAATNAPTRTRREWRRRQMGLVGSQVPLVRCRLHKPVLNLSFEGKIYESPASWELLFTNRVSAADLTPARLFADEPPRPAATSKKDGKDKSP